MRTPPPTTIKNLKKNPSSWQVHARGRRCSEDTWDGVGWEAEGDGGRGVRTAISFELKLCSFAHSSDRATDWLLPLGPRGTAVARSEAGSGENWAFQKPLFSPRQAWGSLAGHQTRRSLNRGETGLSEFSPEGWSHLCSP